MENLQTDDVKEIMSKVMQAVSEPESSFVSEKHSQVAPEEIPRAKKVVKAEDFVKNTVTRLMSKQKKKTTRIEEQQALREKERKKAFTPVPTINPYSKSMVGNQGPLHERMGSILQLYEEKKNEIKKKVEEERKKKEEPELTFKPKILSNHSSKHDFYAYSTSWKEQKLVWDELKKMELKKAEDEHLTFTPKVDDRSSLLFKSTKPSHERLAEWKKNNDAAQQHKRDNLEYTFTPTITEQSRKILKTKSESNVFTRLFSMSREQETDLTQKSEALLESLKTNN